MGGNTALEAVARALENLTRERDSSATGTFARFPLPGVRLQGDKHELQLPLPPTHEQAIMQRAQGSRSRGRGKPTTWELDSSAVELLNPQWDEFVDEIVDELRSLMGIPSGMAMDTTLQRVVLHTQGGRFESSDEKKEKPKQTAGSVATLVVVLPGDFQGGDFVVSQRGKTPIPGPCAVYDVAYVAFCHGCVYKANPVTSGARLSLVYDLVAKNLTNVSRCSSGSTLLQCAVDAALAQYLGWQHADKRLKRSESDTPSTRRSSDKGAERFVYVVTSGSSFEELTDEEREVATSLAAFCASTQGAYALSLAPLRCQRVTCRNYQDDDDAFERDGEQDVTLWLQRPWLPYDEVDDTNGYARTTIALRDEDVIAPDELWTALEEAEWEIEHVGHNQPSQKIQWHAAHALVVQAHSRPMARKKKTRKAT